MAGVTRGRGTCDWVVLHGGAAATYVVDSLTAATRLAEAVAQVPGLAGSGALLTAGDTRLTVRLTRGVEFIEPGVTVNWVDLPYGKFTQTLVTSRVTYTLTPRSSALI